MPNKKPCLGYPSRIEAVAALSEQGLSAQDIAEATGIEVGTVRVMRSQLRVSANHEAPAPQTQIPASVLRALVPAAKARHMAPLELACRILTVTVTENLVDAVLDDASDANGGAAAASANARPSLCEGQAPEARP